VCGAGWRRSGGVPLGGSWRPSLTGTTLSVRMPGWRVRRPTRSTSGMCRHTVVHTSSPGRDGLATHGVLGRRGRSAGSPECSSRSTSGTWKDERTCRSSH
jgi:hypothetical protein